MSRNNRLLETVAARLDYEELRTSAAIVRGFKDKPLPPPNPKPADHVWVACPKGHGGVTHQHFDHAGLCPECGGLLTVHHQPRLTVWFGSMPESNGKRNWTVMLRRAEGDGDALGSLSFGLCYHRSEYYDRARYDADCLRYMIGELQEEPCISEYDADLKEAPKDERPVCSADGCSRREPCGPYCRDNGNFK